MRAERHLLDEALRAPRRLRPSRSIGVSTSPGATALTLIPAGAYVRASPRVIVTIPPFVAL